MGRGTEVPITPSVLQWAVEESGYSVDELAQATRVPLDATKEWGTGKSRPLLTHLRKLAAKLKRPFATFLLPKPPKSTVPAVEFRRPPGSERRELNPVERRSLREAARLQRIVSWIAKELNQGPPNLPRVRISTEPGRVASEARARLGITIEQQVSWPSAGAALHAWRTALETSGVTVLLLPMGRQACRGFSLWDDQTPLVAANTAWNAEARMFTLLHECGHLLTRTSSACLEGTYRRARAQSDETERWCEQFAGLLLLPLDALVGYLEHLGLSGRQVTDVETVRKIARHFRVSLRATTLRLIDLDRANWSLYAALPRWVDDKPRGGGGTGRNRAQIKRDEYGPRTVELFATALEQDVVSRADVLDYLDLPPNAISKVRSQTPPLDERD